MCHYSYNSLRGIQHMQMRQQRYAFQGDMFHMLKGKMRHWLYCMFQLDICCSLQHQFLYYMSQGGMQHRLQEILHQPYYCIFQCRILYKLRKRLQQQLHYSFQRGTQYMC